MKILLVDGSVEVRRQLAATLGTIPGAQIVGEAGSTDAAIRGILALRPDLVLLDIRLDERSGFDVLKVLVTSPGIDFCLLTDFAALPHHAGEFERLRDLVARRVAARNAPPGTR